MAALQIAELTLREFDLPVATEDPTMACIADPERWHVERHPPWLLKRPGARVASVCRSWCGVTGHCP
ncbi:hypothetical protein OG871_06565 [Kitasatospora sp. NBC_00374]|uniref:hypothetical protein n=1 Tax=Kitasatospora sp. NBC_00374 TaxID=2975964 RepID=UPI003254CF59